MSKERRYPIREKSLKAFVQGRYDRETLEDIVKHGCVAGFQYVTYYADTIRLYDRFEDEIWEWLSNEAANEHRGNVLAMIAEFNGADTQQTAWGFKNLLVWAFVESVARGIIDT